MRRVGRVWQCSPRIMGDFMKKVLLISVVLLLLSSLTSCQSNTFIDSDDITADTISIEESQRTSTTYYERVPLIPEKGPAAEEILQENGSTYYYTKGIYPDDEGILCFYADSAEGSVYREFFDWEGRWLSSEELPEIFESASSIFPLQDENGEGYLCIIKEAEKNTQVLYQITTDGAIVNQCDLSAYSMYKPVFAGSDSVYLFLWQEQLVVLDTALSVQGEYTLPVTMDMLYYQKEMFWCMDVDGMSYQIDPTTGQCTPFYKVNTFSGTDPQLVGTGYDLYIVEKDGIIGYKGADIEQAEPNMLLQWTTCDLLKDETEVLYIRDNNHMLVSSKGNMDKLPEYCILRAGEKEAPAEKREVTILYFQDLQNRVIQTAVNLFNRQSTEYTITLLEQELPMTKYKEEEVARAVYDVLSSGTVPDMILLNDGGDNVYLNLQRQGYLMDVTELTTNLTGSAKSAVMEGEQAYRIPYALQYRTLFSPMREDALTVDELLTEAESLPDNEYLFSQYISSLFACMESIFIDSSTATTYFDDPTFSKYLELYARLEEYCNEAYGIYAVQNYTQVQYQWTQTILPDKLQMHELHYLEVPLSNLDAYGVLKLCMGADTLSFCGYPNVPAVISSMYSAAVFRDGACHKGAMAFLEYLLSLEVQSSQVIRQYHMPVTSEAYEKMFETPWTTFSMKEGRIGETGTNGISLIVVERYKNKPENEYYKSVQLTAEDQQTILTLVEDPAVGKKSDPTIYAILKEEISTYCAGDRSIEDTVKILTSRIGTYLSEQK